MSTLHTLDAHVERGTAPGIVVTAGSVDGPIETFAAGDLAADAIVRIQSMAKPILAVATLQLVQAGRLTLDDPVETWLPELADRRVLRTPESPLSDTMAAKPITVRHLLTNTSGYGATTAPSPLQDAMRENRTDAGTEPVAMGAQEWLDAMASLPLMFPPGAGWRYHHSFGILGILLSRVVDASLDDHLRQSLFDPLGMVDTGHVVPREKAHRLPAAYRHDQERGLVEVEPPGAGFYVEPAPFDLSHAELVSTAADYAQFALMLASGGKHRGRPFLDPELVEQLRTDQVPAAIKTPDSFFFPGFWKGTGWGLGVAVVTEGEHAGRYGWSGGLGTDFFINPDGSFQILLTQVEMGPQIMELFSDLQ